MFLRTIVGFDIQSFVFSGLGNIENSRPFCWVISKGSVLNGNHSASLARSENENKQMVNR
jgi:hypothetical protein